MPSLLPLLELGLSLLLPPLLLLSAPSVAFNFSMYLRTAAIAPPPPSPPPPLFSSSSVSSSSSSSQRTQLLPLPAPDPPPPNSAFRYFACYCGSRLWLLLAVLVLALPLLPSMHRMRRSLRPRGASDISCTCCIPPPACRSCSARSTSAVAARWKMGGLASLSHCPGQHSSRSSARPLDLLL